mmetsp:Transcript_9045/g.13923  ORF Transcript_9045/g.13923 Transcript_9045/m.13923 type:complete len:224 (+) Transcript_9045:118-789(+)
MNEAFAYFDNSSLEDVSRKKYDQVFREPPRAKLARLQREAAQLRAELEEESPQSSLNILHQVEDLLLSLERIASGLPAQIPAPDSSIEEARTAMAAVTQGVQTRASVSITENLSTSDDATLAASLGVGPETATLLAEAPPNESLPALLVTRLAALRSLHEQGFEFANRLRAVELEQMALRRTLVSNDEVMSRLAKNIGQFLDHAENKISSSSTVCEKVVVNNS